LAQVRAMQDQHDEVHSARASLLTRRRAVASGIVGALAAPAIGRAQPVREWPNRPVRYINPFSAGGAADTLSRLYCAKMSEVTGQQFVVEDRSGSGGVVGVEAVARSRPDGYTIGLGPSSALTIAPTLYAKLPYGPARDFTLVCGQWRSPSLIVVNKDLPAESVPELIALLKANPGKYAFASAGMGTVQHLAGEMFKRAAGVDVLHVPYRGGGGQAMLDLMAGRVHMQFDNVAGPLPTVREGKARALAVTGARRNPALPNVPALAEFLPGFEIASWTCVCGPAGLPSGGGASLGALEASLGKRRPDPQPPRSWRRGLVGAVRRDHRIPHRGGGAASTPDKGERCASGVTANVAFHQHPAARRRVLTALNCEPCHDGVGRGFARTQGYVLIVGRESGCTIPCRQPRRPRDTARKDRSPPKARRCTRASSGQCTGRATCPDCSRPRGTKTAGIARSAITPRRSSRSPVCRRPSRA
jgi:tripartite-type tricarboxylate transporter receptor subunit TctC